jgi:hypothetical protein
MLRSPEPSPIKRSLGLMVLPVKPRARTTGTAAKAG